MFFVHLSIYILRFIFLFCAVEGSVLLFIIVIDWSLINFIKYTPQPFLINDQYKEVTQELRRQTKRLPILQVPLISQQCALWIFFRKSIVAIELRVPLERKHNFGRKSMLACRYTIYQDLSVWTARPILMCGVPFEMSWMFYLCIWCETGIVENTWFRLLGEIVLERHTVVVSIQFFHVFSLEKSFK